MRLHDEGLRSGLIRNYTKSVSQIGNLRYATSQWINNDENSEIALFNKSQVYQFKINISQMTWYLNNCTIGTVPLEYFSEYNSLNLFCRDFRSGLGKPSEKPFWQHIGYIDVDDGCWRNVLVTDSGCGWPI